MSKDPTAPVHIRLADFGMARRIFPSSIFAYDIIQWVAPEAAHLDKYPIVFNLCLGAFLKNISIFPKLANTFFLFDLE